MDLTTVKTLKVEMKLVKKQVYLALPDDQASAKIKKGLPSEYNSSSYSSIEALLVAVKKHQPEVVLCHVDLLEGKKEQFLAALQEISSTQILMTGPDTSIEKQVASLKLGVRGYFNSALSVKTLGEALHSVINGEVWIERDSITGVIDHLTKCNMSAKQSAQLALLTPKEKVVAQQVSHGASNKMIAKKMMITERTVKAHLTTIFQKMEISDRLSLAIVFRELR